MTLTESEIKILKAMYSQHRPMSIREISKKADVCWLTVKNHLPNLIQKHFIIVYPYKKREYYIFNYQKLKK